MVKHVILWTLKDEFDAEEKERIKAGIKEGLEGMPFFARIAFKQNQQAFDDETNKRLNLKSFHHCTQVRLDNKVRSELQTPLL